MTNISVNFQNRTGSVKPMHAVNNGPAFRSHKPLGEQISNVPLFREAGIPYGRTHDAAFCATYGGEHTVDVHAIFRDFDADPTDPASYDFACTDEYMKAFEAAGTKVFYRLGAKIEHEVKKYGTLPPKDFHKWAVICEHIIRHYTEGWADGYRYDMEYWEIWNEPDLDPDDSANKRCWGGTKPEFFELYHIAATHLKEKFPHLKIGGPAIAGDMKWAEDFLAQLKAPLDFFSWHRYAFTPEKIRSREAEVRALLDKYGFTETESILNEWNYVKGWHGAEIQYSHEMKAGLKGASFVLGTMCVCQNGTVDMLMYYDARLATTWNGLFDHIRIDRPLKGYFPFYMFNQLYRLGTSVEALADGEEGLYATAATDGDEAAVILTHYNDEDTTPPKTVTVELSGLGGENGTEAELYVLDETHDLTLAEKITFFGDRLIWEKEIPDFTCYLIKLKKK